MRLSMVFWDGVWNAAVAKGSKHQGVPPPPHEQNLQIRSMSLIPHIIMDLTEARPREINAERTSTGPDPRKT